MCDVDFDYEPAGFVSTTRIKKARKDHLCNSCKNTIPTGASYLRVASAYDGRAFTEKMCEQCSEISDDFDSKHNFKAFPSALVDTLQHCVEQEEWDGHKETAEYWQSKIEEIHLRGRVD